MGKRYSPQLKFQVVKEFLSTNKTKSQVGREYNVHPNSIGNWEKEFIEKGPDVFDKDGIVSDYEKRIAELEQLVGKKELEIALLKNFLGKKK